MFGFLKSNSLAKKKKQHAKLQEQAMYAQRNGDMRKFAELTLQAETMWQEIEVVEQNQSN